MTPAQPDETVTPLGTRLDEAEIAERRRAVRSLIQQPLITADGEHAAAFGLVRRHAPWLRTWFARHPGWSLTVDAEVARLRKLPADLTDGTRPARARRRDPAFSRRRYVLLCLTLATLERAERQTTLGQLADGVIAMAAEPELTSAGIAFDLKGLDQRRDLVAVTRLLLELRVLRRVHGDEQAYLDDRGDVLYTLNRPALSAVLSPKRGPSTVDATRLEDRLAAITEEPLPDTDDARSRSLRLALTRRLLDDPVVYYDDLTEDELAYLHGQRHRLLSAVTEATGLVAEVRAEGIAMVDQRSDMTDLGLPEEGTDGHVTLLLAEFLAGCARAEPGSAVSWATLHRRTAQLIGEHRSHWRNDVSLPGGDEKLTAETIDRLAALRLVRIVGDGVVPLAAIGRFALDGPQEAL